MKNKGLRVPQEVAELVRHSHPELRACIKAALREILENPTCGKRLRDELEGLRSYRVKRFRIIYRAGTRYIEIIAIGPRRSIYEETFRIISKRTDIREVRADHSIRPKLVIT